MGEQKAIFFMDYMNITQGENGSYSHQGELDIDFAGSNDVYPYYAPFDAKCVRRNEVDYILGWVSLNPVLCADGIVRKVMFRTIHDCNLLYNVGDTVTQGTLIGHTGNCGPTSAGDHVHFEVYNTDVYDTNIVNQLHTYDVLFVPQNVIIVNDEGYPWVILNEDGTWTPPTEQPTTKTPLDSIIHMWLSDALNGWK